MTNEPPPDLAAPGSWPELVPLLPFAYYLWADGTLSEAELRNVQGVVDSLPGLGEGARRAFLAWLDAGHPPSPSALSALGARLKRPVLGAEATRSLSDLGLALWGEAGRKEGPWSDPGARTLLHELEASLGIHGTEVARTIRGTHEDGSGGSSPEVSQPQGFNADVLAAYLDRDCQGARARARRALAEPLMRIPPGLPAPEYRKRVLEALQFLAREGLGSLGFPEEYGGSSDPAGAVAVFETLAFGDLSVVVKFGVQFGLFGGSVLQLGTRRHHERYLGPIGRLELPGCYAMTEADHGSNVRALETTATYDAATDELVIRTPHEGARKHYIGNGALHGRVAVVFARLLVADEDFGVHAVLVPLRDEGLSPLAGVRTVDCGLKEGLNGVDNGQIWFEDVRVPRDNLLDRFATLDRNGQYSSPIPSAGRRFFRMLRTLVMGRVSVASASVSAAKVGLAVAVRHAHERLQFGAEHGPERAILDYPVIQRALMPRLATTYGLHFATHRLQTDMADPSRVDGPELEVAAAGLKAYASEHCVDTLQACREVCGGWGYLAESRLAALKADTDVFTTFEGANLVLYQLVAKGLLSRFRDEMGDLTLRRVVRYVAERAETALTQLNPVTTRRTDEEHLRDPSFHHAALRYREERLQRSAALRIRARMDAGMDSFEAFVECQDHLVTLARAHVERVVLDHFGEAVARAPAPGLSECLSSLSALFALSRIEHDRGWFLESGYLEGAKARAVRAQVTQLCREVRETAGTLVDGFAIPAFLLPSSR